jgi:hypothetical protein
MRGGNRYGAGRPGRRRKCEYALPFDIRRLRRIGRLSAGQSFGWRWSRDGEEFASIGVKTLADAIELDYSWAPSGENRRHILCVARLTFTPCRFGGKRSWFLCPECWRRCEVLYGVTRRGNFACRVCQRLAYASEAESPIDRCWRQQRKLEAQLTEHGGPPKGMHRKTFERICERIDAIEQRKDDLFLPGFYRLVHRLEMTPDDLFK